MRAKRCGLKTKKTRTRSADGAAKTSIGGRGRALKRHGRCISQPRIASWVLRRFASGAFIVSVACHRLHSLGRSKRSLSCSRDDAACSSRQASRHVTPSMWPWQGTPGKDGRALRAGPCCKVACSMAALHRRALEVSWRDATGPRQRCAYTHRPSSRGWSV